MPANLSGIPPEIMITLAVLAFVVYTIVGVIAFSVMKDKIFNVVARDVANKKMSDIITAELNSAHKSALVMILILQVLSLVYFLLGVFGIFSVVINVLILTAVAYGTGYITYNLFMLRKFRVDLVNQIDEERA